MSRRVAVVGANGRVGHALCEHLSDHYDVVPVFRRADDTTDDLAGRATDGVDVVVNAAGVAHVEHPTAADLERVRIGNVELPVALATAALARGVPMIHISSVKAADETAATPYGASKREADERLQREFGNGFAEAGLGLVVLRPLALLFPPLDAGKVKWLRFLRWWPAVLTPAVPLPVLAPPTFLGAVEGLVDECLAGSIATGFSYREFAKAERGTLRDVRDAMLAWTEGKRSR